MIVICCRRAWWLCVLDQYVFRCHIQRLCDKHDRYITRGIPVDL